MQLRKKKSVLVTSCTLRKQTIKKEAKIGTKKVKTLKQSEEQTTVNKKQMTKKTVNVKVLLKTVRAKKTAF